MENPEKVAIIVGGDPTIMRAFNVEPFEDSSEVPCQCCGRGCMVSKSTQLMALGQPTSLVELDKEAFQKETRIAGKGAPFDGVDGAILCMFCAFADQPELLRCMEINLAEARRRLGEA